MAMMGKEIRRIRHFMNVFCSDCKNMEELVGSISYIYGEWDLMYNTEHWIWDLASVYFPEQQCLLKHNREGSMSIMRPDISRKMKNEAMELGYCDFVSTPENRQEIELQLEKSVLSNDQTGILLAVQMEKNFNIISELEKREGIKFPRIEK